MRLVFARDLSLDTTYKRTHIPNADKPEPYIRTQMASCTEAAAAGALRTASNVPQKDASNGISRRARLRLCAVVCAIYCSVRHGAFHSGRAHKNAHTESLFTILPPHHRSNCAARVSFLHCQFSPIAGADERHCATSTRMIHFLIVDKIHQDVCVCVLVMMSPPADRNEARCRWKRTRNLQMIVMGGGGFYMQ